MYRLLRSAWQVGDTARGPSAELELRGCPGRHGEEKREGRAEASLSSRQALQVEDHNQTRVTGSSAKAARTVRVSTSVVCAADR